MIRFIFEGRNVPSAHKASFLEGCKYVHVQSYIPCHLKFIHYIYLLQHWYISGSVKCFQGGHAPLGLLAILILAFCVTLIPLVLVYSVGWVQVLINSTLKVHSI